MIQMPSSIGSFLFDMPEGLWALAGVLPFIILYLIRPRPKRLEMPSLMFFIRTSGKSIVSSFLRTFMRDILFFIQLVIVLALLLIPSQPHTTTQISVTAESTVLVIDTSASMQAREDGSTRLDKAISEAGKLIGQKTTIILAKGTPELLIKDAIPQTARQMLQIIKPTETASRIGEAMIMAAAELEGKGRVVVISDFDNTDGVEPMTALSAIQSQGKDISLINVARTQVNNVGFIDFVPGEDQSTAYVQNFGSTEASVQLTVGSEHRQLTIPAGGLEPVQFKTPAGLADLTLQTNDPFPADDMLHVSGPPQKQIRVLLITNDKSRFLESALTSSPLIDLAVAEPPIIPKDGYDIYVLSNLKKSEVLPGTFPDLLERAKQGAGVIIELQDGIGTFNWGDLMPAEFTGEGNGTAVIIDQQTTITRDIEFGNLKWYVKARPTPGAMSLASTTDNSTVLALKSVGAGAVVYMGIPETSDFKIQPDYPIFWQRLLKILAKRQDVLDLNKKTGDSIQVPTGAVLEGPMGSVQGPVVTLERSGVYTLGDRQIAVNFLNAAESALVKHDIAAAAQDAGSLSQLKEERQLYLENWLLIIAAVFLVIELMFLKVRGDI
jgi:hypothetical protein